MRIHGSVSKWQNINKINNIKMFYSQNLNLNCWKKRDYKSFLIPEWLNKSKHKKARKKINKNKLTILLCLKNSVSDPVFFHCGSRTRTRIRIKIKHCSRLIFNLFHYCLGYRDGLGRVWDRYKDILQRSCGTTSNDLSCVETVPARSTHR